MKIFINGLTTGLILQLAIGPVFFFIANVTIQRTIFDGLAGVLAVTFVDYFYITLAILGIGKLLENNKVKRTFGIISSVVLAISSSTDLFSSFASVFFLTISSPMTIVFFTSLFTAKAVEYNYAKRELLLFGFGTGMATLLFMGTSVLVFSLIKGNIPVLLIQILNLIVGCLLIGYGVVRFVKVVNNRVK